MVYFKRCLFLLFIFFFCLCTVSYGATVVNPTDTKEGIAVQYDNSYLTLYNFQYNTQTEFINYCYANFSNANVKNMVYVIYQQFSQLGLNGKFMSISEPINENNLFAIYFGFLGNTTSSSSNVNFGNKIGFANVPCLTGKWYRVVQVDRNDIIFPDTEENMSGRPLAFCQCIHDKFPQLFKDFGLIDNVKDYTNSLGDVKSAIDTTNKIMQQVDNTIKNESDKIRDSIKNSTDSINNTITDSTIDDVPISELPTDNTNDITKDGFDALFQNIQDIFVNGVSKDIVINIPFTDKSFVINASTVYGDTSRLGFVKTFIEGWYYFFISLFIVYDIKKKINKIKSGNIENVQSNDIKADIL